VLAEGRQTAIVDAAATTEAELLSHALPATEETATR
jgi:hypothetical protein